MEKQKLSLEETYLKLAKKLNNETWALLEKQDRTPSENDRMRCAAYGSCYHWLVVGTPVHHQRGEWLIARVHTVLGEPEAALQHAKRCLVLAVEHKEEMADFDLPYAYEAMARAYALAGDGPEARCYRVKAN